MTDALLIGIPLLLFVYLLDNLTLSKRIARLENHVRGVLSDRFPLKLVDPKVRESIRGATIRANRREAEREYNEFIVAQDRANGRIAP
jgi:hypothetical protein